MIWSSIDFSELPLPGFCSAGAEEGPEDSGPSYFRGGATLRDRHRPAVLVEVHVGDLGLGHLHAVAETFARLRHDLHRDRDRRAADPDEPRVERHEVADVDRLVEDDLAHRHRDEELGAVPLGLDGAGLVDVGEDDAAEDRAVRVGVLRHHDDADGGLAGFCPRGRAGRHGRALGHSGRAEVGILGGPKLVETRWTRAVGDVEHHRAVREVVGPDLAPRIGALRGDRQRGLSDPRHDVVGRHARVELPRASASVPGTIGAPTPAILSASRYSRFSHQRGSHSAAATSSGTIAAAASSPRRGGVSFTPVDDKAVPANLWERNPPRLPLSRRSARAAGRSDRIRRP